MLLLGFLNVQLPNGKIGDEADTITKNEGWSGVTLNSNSSETPYAQGVANISIVKFYPTQDHHKVLHDQLSNNFLIKTIANEYVDDFETGIKFYEIVYKENRIFYAKISLDEEGSRY